MAGRAAVGEKANRTRRANQRPIVERLCAVWARLAERQAALRGECTRTAITAAGNSRTETVLTCRALQAIDISGTSGRRAAGTRLASALANLVGECVGGACGAIRCTLARLKCASGAIEARGRTRRGSILARLARNTRCILQRVVAYRCVRSDRAQCARWRRHLAAECTRSANRARRLSSRGRVSTHLAIGAKRHTIRRLK